MKDTAAGKTAFYGQTIRIACLSSHGRGIKVGIGLSVHLKDALKIFPNRVDTSFETA